MDLSKFSKEELIVFEYTFIDDIEYFRKPEDLFTLNAENVAELERVRAAFKKHGWEGDGDIGVIWIPPFFYNASNNEDPGQVFGELFWHVKQYNNGISFIAFYPEGLNFISKESLLARYNDRFFDRGKN